MDFQFQDLIEHFEVELIGLEVKIRVPDYPQTTQVLEKFCASITLMDCIIPDDSILKNLEVYIVISSLNAHFSSSIYVAILGLIAHLDVSSSKSEEMIISTLGSLNVMPNGPRTLNTLRFSIGTNLQAAKINVNLENDAENSSIFTLSLREFAIRYNMTAFEVFYISMRTVEIMCCSSKDRNGHILCSSSSHQQDTANGLNIRTDDAEGCFLLKYERHNIVDSITPGFTILLNNIDLHCYPYVSGLLVGFYDRISKYGTSYIPHLEDENLIPVLSSGLEQFGVSNFLGPGSSEWTSIPVDRFPFVTINNAGSLGSLDKSLIYPISEWRNHFSVRDKHIGSLKSRPERMCKTFPVLESKPSSLVDFNLHGVRVHFHDDSCIIGTFTLPLSKSSLSFHNDCVDVLCSTEGLVLTSPWWTQNFFEFLWALQSQICHLF